VRITGKQLRRIICEEIGRDFWRRWERSGGSLPHGHVALELNQIETIPPGRPLKVGSEVAFDLPGEPPATGTVCYRSKNWGYIVRRNL